MKNTTTTTKKTNNKIVRANKILMRTIFTFKCTYPKQILKLQIYHSDKLDLQNTY